MSDESRFADELRKAERVLANLRMLVSWPPTLEDQEPPAEEQTVVGERWRIALANLKCWGERGFGSGGEGGPSGGGHSDPTNQRATSKSQARLFDVKRSSMIAKLQNAVAFLQGLDVLAVDATTFVPPKKDDDDDDAGDPVCGPHAAAGLFELADLARWPKAHPPRCRFCGGFMAEFGVTPHPALLKLRHRKGRIYDRDIVRFHPNVGRSRSA